MSPVADPPVAPATAGSPFAHLTTPELDALISDLQAIRATRQATAQQTQVEHHEGG